MTPSELASPLSEALAARGYDSLTSVQQAVVATEAKGRDLLVSAQTGSGKTVAFGLAIATDLLDDGQLPEAGAPVALVIAPTRELALQVARELAWLYADARVATCVGGMDFRTERRALERGAQIVVGTPGRLRDHLERGSLDLTGLRACVLDEADEMLDLGFREDLELILRSAPAERRTLMFSATVPPGIAKLANEFQKDALRIAATGEARQHSDIAYIAVSVTGRDRENAIFNLLRFHEARSAIVFCKTRANVNHLIARMGNRGFKAVALSGELSQQERTLALQALRDGRAQVCVATDVAARGIDLPGLELVIHADLPTNAESLLHRSGRTGRAGAKGRSVLVVTPGEVKRAQRVLHEARVEAEWQAAPSADDVRARDDLRVLEHPALTAEEAGEAPTAALLLQRFGPEGVAAAFVRLWREGRPVPEELSDAPAPPGARPAPRERGEFGASVWFTLSVGHTGRAEARWLLPKICEAGGITREAIGAIRVRQDETFVQIATTAASGFGDGVELEEGLSMRRLPGEPTLERPERGARPERPPQASTGDSKPAGKWDPDRDALVDTRGTAKAPYRKPRSEEGSGPAALEGKPRKPKAAAGKPGAAPHGGPTAGRPYAGKSGKAAGKPAEFTARKAFPKPGQAKTKPARPFASGAPHAPAGRTER